MFLKEGEKRFQLIKSVDQLYEILRPAFVGYGVEKEDFIADETDVDGCFTDNRDFKKIQECGCLIKRPHAYCVVVNDFCVVNIYGDQEDKFVTGVLIKGLVKTEGKKAVKLLREYKTRERVDPDMQCYYAMVGITDPLELYKEDTTENE